MTPRSNPEPLRDDEGAAPGRTAHRPSAADAVRGMYEAHAGFVYQSLARLGVRQADLPDLTHEVFLVAHRRHADRLGGSSDRTWLFGIAMKLAAAYRRRAFRIRERLFGEVPDPTGAHPAGSYTSAPAPASPEDETASREARATATTILDGLPPEERVAFMMFEVEGLTCPVIADELGWPLGTVYTRVRNARRRFEAAARRLRARDRYLEEKGGAT